MRNTTTTVVIAAGVVLAAVIVTRTPGQVEYGPAGACCYPTGCLTNQTMTVCITGGGTWLEGGGCNECPPPPGPTVASTSVTIQTEGLGVGRYYRVWRTWSDGQVDMTFIGFSSSTNCNLGGPAQCGPIVLIPGTCPTDVDRDGDTGINDFLTLLGGWGACR